MPFTSKLLPDDSKGSKASFKTRERATFSFFSWRLPLCARLNSSMSLAIVFTF